jgi:hypothetical protein
MCTTIQVAVPAETAWELGRRLLSHGDVEPIGEIDGQPMLLVSDGRCECGTALGSGSSPAEWDEASYGHDVKRLRKRGWSEHKIARWLETKRSSHAKLERLAHEHADGPAAQPVDGWLEWLENALGPGAVGQVGLRVCHGDESWSAATPHVTRRIADVGPADLRAMEESTLYVFVP